MRRKLNPKSLFKQFRDAEWEMVTTERIFQMGGYSIKQSERKLEKVYHHVMKINSKIETIRKYRHNLHLSKRLIAL